MKKNKVVHGLLIFVLLTVTLLAGCTKSSTPAEPAVTPAPAQNNNGGTEIPTPAVVDAGADEEALKRVINIGYNGGLCQAPIAIAQEKGFFAAEGLNTQLVKAAVPRDAIAGGLLDTSAGMIAAWLKPVTNGVNIVFTVGLHTGCTSVVTLPDSGIEKIADAKGKPFAISGGIGGVNHNIAYRMLAHDNLQTTDFQWKDFPEDQLLLVLQRKEAPIAVVSDQLAEKWVQEGLVKRIRSTTLDEDFHDEACCVLGISGEFIEKNPVTAEKISKAVYKAAQWVEENKLEAAKIMIEKGHISGTPEYAVDLLNLYKFAIPKEDAIESIYTSVDEYKQLGVIDANLDAEKLKEQIFKVYDSIYE